MSSTYTSLYAHVIFSTQDRFPFLSKSLRPRLHEFLGGIVRNIGARSMRVGGVEDHVHILLSIPPTLATADALEKIKSNSSRWIHDTFPELSKFKWQRGYGAFSVSPSRLQSVIDYIDNQEEHHRTKTFQEEFVEFLVISGIEFDERYIWS